MGRERTGASPRGGKEPFKESVVDLNEARAFLDENVDALLEDHVAPLAEAENPHELIRHVLGVVLALTCADRTYHYRYRGGAWALSSARVGKDFEPPNRERPPTPFHLRAFEKAVGTGKVLALRHLYGSAPIDEGKATALPLPSYESVWCAAMIAGGECYGVLCADTCAGNAAMDLRDLVVLGLLARCAAQELARLAQELGI